jgi:DNA-binding CsgD family transcriptional regulator
MLSVFIGRIALARGDVETAASAAGTAAELLRGSPQEDQHQFPLGVLEIGLRLAVAGPGAALEVASQVVDGYELAGGSPRYAWPLLASAALACVVAARDERLRADVAALADRLRTIAAKLETSGSAQQASQATFAAADAQVAGLGDAGDWLAAWDEAAAAWAGVSEPYSQAEALLHAAEAALAGGDRDGAAGRLRLAAALAAALGAGFLAAEIALLARRGRIVLDTSSAALGSSAVGLTGRELEVLRLVAAGRSNREIANELFISPKTASVHVSNIMGKLGAASRGEAAAKAHALRLVDPAL